MIKRLLRKVLNQLGFEPVRKAEFERLVNFAKRQHPSASLWSVLNQSQRGLIGNYMEQSKSQLAQDLFVLSQSERIPIKSFSLSLGRRMELISAILGFWSKLSVGPAFWPNQRKSGIVSWLKTANVA
jgi:hypothetical protein